MKTEPAFHMVIWSERKFGFYSTKAAFYRWAYLSSIAAYMAGLN